jgi:hypothetical protein
MTIKFANSPLCACSGSSGQKPQYGLRRWHVSVSQLCCFLSMAVSFWVASIIVWVFWCASIRCLCESVARNIPHCLIVVVARLYSVSRFQKCLSILWASHPMQLSCRLHLPRQFFSSSAVESSSLWSGTWFDRGGEQNVSRDLRHRLLILMNNSRSCYAVCRSRSFYHFVSITVFVRSRFCTNISSCLQWTVSRPHK